MGYFGDNYNSVRYPILSEHSAGLRRAQLGAIHAIASHFTRYTAPSLAESAMVVMPNGSGKTAVLMLSAFVLKANRVLVITPSRSVREQVAWKFQSLAELKEIGALASEVNNPNVKLLDSKLITTAAWRDLEEYDVVVSTPNCTSPEYEDVVHPPEGLFDLLLIDEAHHAPAKTWRAIVEAFPDAKKVLFTATPFRLDRKVIPGTIIYEFSIREARNDKIFGDIEFVPVQLQEGHSLDITIARKTEEVYKQDQDLGFDHRILVRTNTKKHAKELRKVYEDHTGLVLRLIHSGQSLRYIDQSVNKLRKKELAGIICVDMLGEGFDFPNLKIAAVHAPHKSLPVTLQFIGRFARTNVAQIGKAKFVAIPENIRIDAEHLYKQDKVWQEIIPDLYQSRVDRELRMRQAISKFETVERLATDTEDEVKDLSLYSLTPFHHVKIYELQDGANLDVDIELDELQVIRQDKSEELTSLLILTKEVRFPPWTSTPICARVEYDLLVIYFDTKTNLLFINSSRRIETLYAKIAKQVAVGRYKPLPLSKINQVLAGLESPEFFNIGMRNRLWNSQIESYRIIAGPGAHRAVTRSDGRLYHRGHVFGRGGPEDKKVTLGYSSSSKVWSNKYSNVSELIDWCESLAQKIVSDASVVTGSNVDQLSVGETISSLPNNILTVDWHESVYLNPRTVKYQSDDSTTLIRCQLLDLDLTIDRASTNSTKIRVRVQGPELDWAADYSPQSHPFFKTVTSNKKELIVLMGYREMNLIDFLNERPVLFYTVDQSLIAGSQIFRAIEGFAPYDKERIEVVDWDAESVDIQNESGSSPLGIKSIHEYLEDRLSGSDCDIVFYDHGSGEIADFIAFKRIERTLSVSLYHVKASSSAKPGARVTDVYEVCGQALKSTRWFRPRRLVDQIAYRLSRGHDFVKGDLATLETIANEPQTNMTYEITLVQPGLSKQSLTPAIFEVLASSSDYTVRSGGRGLGVIGSS